MKPWTLMRGNTPFILEMNVVRKSVGMVVVVVMLALLGGCASYQVVGPEARKINRFLSRVQQHCGNRTVGGMSVASLFGMNTQDPIFLSWTTDLATGKLSKEEYARTINGSYPGYSNERAISCITGQLDASK
jgi:hypothetical protein